jgi:hypothetical protein
MRGDNFDEGLAWYLLQAGIAPPNTKPTSADQLATMISLTVSYYSRMLELLSRASTLVHIRGIKQSETYATSSTREAFTTKPLISGEKLRLVFILGEGHKLS